MLRKEITLAATPLTWLFLAFAALTLCPGYPILCAAFFITLGIFQSFRSARENNDIAFSVLLPVAKGDVVRGKFLFVMLIEGCGFLIIAALTLLRMTVFSSSVPYRSNALMNANLFSLGLAAVIFGLFNAVFLGGFFKTAVRYGKPFVLYTVSAFLVILVGETLHHLPGLEALNAFGFDAIGTQLSLLAAGLAVYAALTAFSCRLSRARFEKIDL